MVAVPIVAHILGAFFDPKTSILGWVILAPLGSILVALGSPGDPKGSPMKPNEKKSGFWELFPLYLGSHFDTFFWTKIIKKRFPDVVFCDLWPTSIVLKKIVVKWAARDP